LGPVKFSGPVPLRYLDKIRFDHQKRSLRERFRTIRRAKTPEFMNHLPVGLISFTLFAVDMATIKFPFATL